MDDTGAQGTADGAAEAIVVVPALVGLDVGDAHDLARGAVLVDPGGGEPDPAPLLPDAAGT